MAGKASRFLVFLALSSQSKICLESQKRVFSGMKRACRPITTCQNSYYFDSDVGPSRIYGIHCDAAQLISKCTGLKNRRPHASRPHPTANLRCRRKGAAPDPTNRRLELTRSGQLLLQKSKNLFNEEALFASFVRELRGKMEGKLVVSTGNDPDTRSKRSVEVLLDYDTSVESAARILYAVVL